MKKIVKKRNIIISKIESLEKNLENLDSPNLAEKKKELETLQKQKMNGIMKQSRAQWLSKLKKPYNFLALWKSITIVKKQLRS